MANPSYSVRKRGKKYEACWRNHLGKSQGRTFLTHAQALAYARNKAIEAGNVIAGIGIAKQEIRVALKAFLRREGIQDNTHDLNRYRVNDFIKITKVSMVHEITEDTINKYWRTLKKRDANPGGQNHNLKIIKAFCNFCRRKKWLPEWPFGEDFKMPQSEFEGKKLTGDEIEKLLFIDPTVEADIHLNPIFTFGLYSLLRISRVFEADWTDFTAPDQFRVKKMKGEAEDRVITLHPKAIAAMGEVKAIGRIFTFWPTLSGLRSAIYSKVNRAGLHGVRFHETKHTGISALLEAGYSPAEVSEISGTTQQTIINHYSHANKKPTFDKWMKFDHGEKP